MVAPLVLGALIAAGASLAGGALRNRAIRRENKIDRARQDNQLQRMMADAGLAGIHPVAALGASANYGQPVGQAETGFAEGLESAGGAVSDLMMAQQDFQISAQSLELERMRLENEMRAFELQEAQSRSILSAVRGAALQAPAAIVNEPSPAILSGMPWAIGAGGPYTPARVAEDAYGEVGEWVFGVPNLIRDWRAVAAPSLWEWLQTPLFGYGDRRLYLQPGEGANARVRAAFGSP